MSRFVSETDIERAEEDYRNLEKTYRQLGFRFVEAVREGKSLEEFQSLRRDIAYLLRNADLKRTELRYEYLAQRLGKLENEHRQAHQAADRAAESLKKAQRTIAEAQNTARRLDLEVSHLRELREKEETRLKRLREEARHTNEATPS